MTERTSLKTLVAAVAAGSGALVTLLLGSLLMTRDPELRAAEQQYRQLSPEEAQRLQSTFARLQKSPEEQQRIRSIHQSVTSSAELDADLQQLYSWWTSRSDAQRADLRELHSSAELWTKEVQRQYAASMSKGRIELQVPPRPGRGGTDGPPAIYVARDQIDRFLEDAVPESALTTEESTLLDAVDPADQSLARILIVARHLFPARQGGRPVDDDVVRQVYLSASRHLLPASQTPRPPEGYRDVMRALGLLRSIKRHLSTDFLERHAVSEETLEEQFAALDSSARLKYMSSDPHEATRSLQAQLAAADPSTPTSRLAGLLHEFDRQSSSTFQRLRRMLEANGPGGEQTREDRRRRGAGARGLENLLRRRPGPRGPDDDRPDDSGRRGRRPTDGPPGPGPPEGRGPDNNRPGGPGRFPRS